jgi:hypothetical protein
MPTVGCGLRGRTPATAVLQRALVQSPHPSWPRPSGCNVGEASRPRPRRASIASSAELPMTRSPSRPSKPIGRPRRRSWTPPGHRAVTAVVSSGATNPRPHTSCQAGAELRALTRCDETAKAVVRVDANTEGPVVSTGRSLVCLRVTTEGTTAWDGLGNADGSTRRLPAAGAVNPSRCAPQVDCRSGAHPPAATGPGNNAELLAPDWPASRSSTASSRSRRT